jgi:prophage tail gpP-like protein
MNGNDIQIEVNGIKYTGWERASVTKSIETFCGSFNFIGTFTRGADFPIKVDDECRIFVNEISIINGFVDKINVFENSNTHTLNISGRDKTCDLIDNTLPASNEKDEGLKLPDAPYTLKELTKSILKFYGITNIKVIDPYNLSPIKDKAESTLGEGAEDFLQQYASKKNVLITTDNNGDIIFQRAKTDIYETVLSKQINDAQIIKETTANFDNTKRFHIYRVRDQANPMTDIDRLFDRPPPQAVNLKGEAIDNEIRKTRIFYLSSDDTSQQEDAHTRAQWESNFRRAQSRSELISAQGFKPLFDNGIWETNKLVRINDPASGINTKMLISSVTFTKSLTEGSITTLKCVPSDSFTLQVNKPKKQKADELATGGPYFIPKNK